MPKNMGKGGKSFKAGNAKGNMLNDKRDLIYADTEDGEEYAQVKKALGNLRLELQLAGGTTVIGVIRGAMVRKVWIAQGDIVLISKRSFNVNDTVDIIHRYRPAEVRVLVKENAIPRDFSAADERQKHGDGGYVFVEGDEEVTTQDTYTHGEVLECDPLADLDNL